MKRPVPAGVVLFVTATAGDRADVTAAVQIARPPQIGREDPALEPNTDCHGADEDRRQRSEEAGAARHVAILTGRRRAGLYIRRDAAASPVVALTFLGSSFSASP